MQREPRKTMLFQLTRTKRGDWTADYSQTKALLELELDWQLVQKEAIGLQTFLARIVAHWRALSRLIELAKSSVIL
jgi:hypothetical protein